MAEGALTGASALGAPLLLLLLGVAAVAVLGAHLIYYFVNEPGAMHGRSVPSYGSRIPLSAVLTTVFIWEFISFSFYKILFTSFFLYEMTFPPTFPTFIRLLKSRTHRRGKKLITYLLDSKCRNT